MDYIEVIKALSPLVVGFGGAYIGSMLALTKFKKEKFWDERRSGYKSVIDAYEELDCWSEIVRAESCCEPSRNVNIDPNAALRVIEKYSKIGGMLFSNDFQEVLIDSFSLISRKEFEINNESLGDTDTEQKKSEWYAIYAREVKAIVAESLPRLVEIAKHELPRKT